MTAVQSAAISRRNQSLTPGGIVELFTLDVAPLGYPAQFCFTSGAPANYKGVAYAGIDCEVEGFEWSGSGPLPRPQFRITNATNLMIAAVLRYDDLVGALFTRDRTYARYLDDGEEPGADAQFSRDIYTVEQKSGQEETMIEWILASAMDQDGRLLPGRTMRRDTCGFPYRNWNEATRTFDTTWALCPYRGSRYFDALGAETTIEKDVCGKRLSDCKKRFGDNAELPYGGFIGMSRLRS